MASDKDFFRSTLAKLPMPRCRSVRMRSSALEAARFLFATINLYVDGDGGGAAGGGSGGGVGGAESSSDTSDSGGGVVACVDFLYRFSNNVSLACGRF